MLQPTRTKYRKAHKGRIHGYARRGEILNYGSYGLKAMQPERIISKQIEAARIALTTYGLIGVKVWINKGEVFAKDKNNINKKETENATTNKNKI